MTKRKTMTDIARECGVSQSTVSLVLSNNPRIGEATRAKILQAIERSGYRPNIHARGLVMDSSRIISVEPVKPFTLISNITVFISINAIAMLSIHLKIAIIG